MNDRQHENMRRHQVRTLWKQRPEGDRSGHDLLVFYLELMRDKPELLPPGADSHDDLRDDLHGLIER